MGQLGRDIPLCVLHWTRNNCLMSGGEIKQLALLNSSSVHAPGVEQLIDKPKEESLALEVGELQLIKHLPKFLI